MIHSHRGHVSRLIRELNKVWVISKGSVLVFLETEILVLQKLLPLGGKLGCGWSVEVAWFLWIHASISEVDVD